MSDVKQELIAVLQDVANTAEDIGEALSHMAVSLGKFAKFLEEETPAPPTPPVPPPPEPSPNKRSIYGWNIGPQAYWRPARHFQNKLWGCNKLVMSSDAEFDAYGDLLRGEAHTRLVIDPRHTAPSMYNLCCLVEGGEQIRMGFSVTEDQPRKEIPLKLTGEMEMLTLVKQEITDWQQAAILFDTPAKARFANNGCLRWMDLRHTNRAQAANGNHYRYDPVEKFIYETVPPYMVALNSNLTRTDCWWNVHHKDTEAEITRDLMQLRQMLHPELKVYVEHSNEVWNFRWKDGPSRESEMWDWHNARTNAIGKIAKQILGDRCVVVLGAQAADAGRTKLFLRNGAEYIDAIAIAPYWGWESYFAKHTDRWLSGGTAEVLRFLDEDEKKTRDWIIAQKQVAVEHGLRLLAYEHGSHLWLEKTAPNRDQVNQLFLEANRSDELAEQYERRMDFWEQEVGDTCLWYCDVHHEFGHWEWELSQPQLRAVAIQNRIHKQATPQ